eukprot:6212804-Pleurochrysis_carterae.AAC.2
MTGCEAREEGRRGPKQQDRSHSLCRAHVEARRQKGLLVRSGKRSVGRGVGRGGVLGPRGASVWASLCAPYLKAATAGASLSGPFRAAAAASLRYTRVGQGAEAHGVDHAFRGACHAQTDAQGGNK